MIPDTADCRSPVEEVDAAIDDIDNAFCVTGAIRTGEDAGAFVALMNEILAAHGWTSDDYDRLLCDRILAAQK